MFVKIVHVQVGEDSVEVNAAHIATVRPHREHGERTGAAEVRMANGAAVVGIPDFASLSSLFCPSCGFPLGSDGKCIMPLCAGSGGSAVGQEGVGTDSPSPVAQLDEDGPASESPAGESPVA